MASSFSMMLHKFLSILISVLDTLLALLLTVIFVPVLFLLWLLNETVRVCLIAPILRVTYGDRLWLVPDGADNVWHFKKFGNSRNMLIITIYETKIDPEEYQKNFNARVLNHIDMKTGVKSYQKLKQIYTSKLGYNCWKRDENFDVRNHVKVLHSNNKDGHILTESAVLKVLGQLTDDIVNKPQWEDLIITDFVYDEDVEEMVDGRVIKLKPGVEVRSARIFRCHHGIMDGASYLQMTSIMTDGDFPFSADPKIPLIRNKWRRYLVTLGCFLFGVKTAMRTVIVAAGVQNRFVTRQFSGNTNHSWSRPIQLERIKEIKGVTRSSVPTILASVIAGALRKLDESYPVLKEGKDCDRGQEGGEVFAKPSDELLMGMIGAVLPYKDVAPKNRYTVVNFTANTSPCTRLRRLEAFDREMKGLAAKPDFLVNLWMFQIFGRFPAFFVQNMMKNGGSPVVISNTPWARRSVKMLGDPVQDLGGWVPLLAFSGLGILITRYCETLRVCGVAEEACLSKEQLNFVIGEVQKEIMALSEECAVVNKILNPDSIIPKKF
ncbi:unnamed protein product [Allacma fusca]|uniref:O-acyltransferase WSD1 C-terminal domain-containing protein n=1 Tax=Allacma fusca TaxID=39272 RepID=A0A8J2LG38_9HEXA|nr:unnamed protein product [Allacma fusca]